METEYDYFEPGSTVVQPDDETPCAESWGRYHPHYRGKANDFLIRRPKVKPSPVAPGHNPAGLTVDQVGEGYRLLREDEVRSRDIFQADKAIQAWDGHFKSWDIGGNSGYRLEETYRVPIGWEEPVLVTGLSEKEEEEQTYTTVRIDNGIYNIPNRYAPIIKELLQEIGGME